MVAPLPRRVAPVIRRAVDDLVDPAGEAPGDAVTAAGAPATLAAPAVRGGPPAPGDAVSPASGQTPDEWRPR